MAEGKILMVDDDKEIADLVEIHLKGEGYQVYKAYNGKEALEIFDAEEIDLAILDIMMPGMDGNEVCAKIRQTSTIPIIMLSAKDSESDKVSGLVNGADDYVTKPFNTSELIARVKAQLRRYMTLGGGEVESKNDESEFVLGGIELNDSSKKVFVDGEEKELTPTEFEILKLFLKQPGKVIPPKEIYRKVWNDAPIGSEGTVAVHIRHLREKIEINPSEPRYLKVVWGQGYKCEI